MRASPADRREPSLADGTGWVLRDLPELPCASAARDESSAPWRYPTRSWSRSRCLRRPATSAVETLRLSPPLGATLWLWCGTATPHRDDHLADRWLVTLSVRSAHGIGDALTDEPETPFPRGTLAVIDPSTVHWLVPSCTEMADDAGRITLPLWVGLQWEIDKNEHAPARVHELLDGLGGAWTRKLDPRYVGWAKCGEDAHDGT